MATDPTRVRSYVAELRSILEARDGSGKPEIKRKIKTLVANAGHKKRSAKLMREYAETLDRQGVQCSVDIEDLSISIDAWARFSLHEFVEPGPEFESEKIMEAFLGNHPEHLRHLLPDVGRLYPDSGGLLPQKKYAYEGTYVLPDMVFHDRRGRRVVVELKTGAPGRGAVNQLTGYISAIAHFHGFSREDRAHRVIGLLITGRPRSRATRRRILHEMRARRHDGFDLRWACYEVDFRAEDMAPFEEIEGIGMDAEIPGVLAVG